MNRGMTVALACRNMRLSISRIICLLRDEMMTETSFIPSNNPYDQKHLKTFDIDVEIPIDEIFACIYVPQEGNNPDVLSVFKKIFDGKITLNISCAFEGRKFQILGYQKMEDGSKKLVAYLQGSAEILKDVENQKLKLKS